jgi:hypothetical protein
MTATESAERALFAATAAEFLDKEASLRTVRELQPLINPSNPGGGAVQQNWAGRLCWSVTTSAAAVCPETG